jgi:hypothetical protein
MDFEKILFLYEVDEKQIRSLYKRKLIRKHFENSREKLLNLFL